MASDTRRKLAQLIAPGSLYLGDDPSVPTLKDRDIFADMARSDGINPDGSRRATISARDPSNADAAQDILRTVLPRSTADRLSPGAGAMMDAAPIPAQMLTEVGRGIVNQPFVAGKALSDAYSDPTLAHLTNAGVQTAAAIPTNRMLQAGAGIMAGGLGIAGARDLGLGMVGSAKAGWTADQDARRSQLRKDLAEQNYKSAADRRAKQDELKRLEGLYEADQLNQGEVEKLRARAKIDDDAKNAELERTNKAAADASKQAEYNAAVRRADQAKADALARLRPFDDTQTGQVLEATGGLGPFFAAMGMGGITRAATGPAKDALTKYALPAVTGSGGALTANSAKLIHDYNTDTENPEYIALRNYGRELPIGHPNKARAEAASNDSINYPKLNPVREDAAKKMTDPMGWLGRAAASIAEGVSGGIGGSEVVGALSRAPGAIGAKIGEFPGQVRGGYLQGQAGADEAAIAALAAREKRRRLAQLVEEGTGRTQSGRGQIAEADALVPPAAIQEGASSVQVGGPSGRSSPLDPTTAGQGQPPQRAPSGNPSDPLLASTTDNKSPLVPMQQGSLPSNQGGNRSLTVSIPGMTDLIDALRARQEIQKAGPMKSLPPPGRGSWADDIQPTAREVLMNRADGGGSIAKGTGAEIGRQIDNALPGPTKRPSAADVRDRVSNLRDFVGERPSRDDLHAIFDQAPDSVFKGKKIPVVAGPVAAGAAAGALAPDDAEASPAITDRRLALARALMASGAR